MEAAPAFSPQIVFPLDSKEIYFTQEEPQTKKKKNFLQLYFLVSKIVIWQEA